MKFVFLCDSNYVRSELKNFMENFPKDHELIAISGDDLLSSKRLPDCDALIVDRATWQKYFSLFRYMELLDQLETVPIGAVIRGRRSESLKGRAGFKEVLINYSGSTEDILSSLDRLLANARELTGFSGVSVKS